MFFTAVVRGTENTAVIRCSGMNVKDQEKVAAVTTLRQAVKKQQPQEMLTWVNACRPLPTYERICTRAAIADSLRKGRADRLHVEEAGRRGRPVSFMHGLGGGNGDKADASHSRMDTEELITSSCSAGKSFARSSTAWQQGETTARVVAEGETRDER